MTLLEGERKVNQEFHKPEFLKSLKKETLVKTVENIENLLKQFIK
jgi:hypothetical protein